MIDLDELDRQWRAAGHIDELAIPALIRIARAAKSYRSKAMWERVPATEKQEATRDELDAALHEVE
jgi:hypothetical protein